MGNNKKLWIIILIFIVTGIMTSIQFKQDTSRTDIITIKSLYEDQKNIDNEKLELEKLNKKVEKLEEKLDSYNREEYKVEDIISSLRKELEANRIVAGFRDLEGPGIRIEMEDSDQFEEGQNLNNFIIHNSDVLQIINDLKVGGAERISINGSPILWHSEIDCNGATIKVEQDIFAPPFVIEAIGDPQKLEGILKAPDGIIQLMEIWDIQIDIKKEKNIAIKGIQSVPSYKYLKKVKEGEK